MIQEIITYSILIIVAAYLVFSIYRFFKPSVQKTGCAGGCAGCPLMKDSVCQSNNCIK
ncbi:MAG: FeoB-associated Cys-rich membrane protein [Bacteroidota bacterium]